MTNFDPPSEPPDPPCRGSHGGRMVLEKCENCEGTGRLYKGLGRYIDKAGHRYDICANCHGNGEIWVEDLPDERED